MLFTSKIEVELIDKMGSDLSIVHSARVSTIGDTRGCDVSTIEQTGLINYLMKHRHGTPFEHSCVTLFVNAPIFVWREWHRHRVGFSYNEESARYKVLEPKFYLPDISRPMFKVNDWKPGRPKFLSVSDVPNGIDIFQQLCTNLRKSYTFSYEMYLDNLSMGIDPGLARDCLPVGIFSSCYVTCNPRSLMAFLSLRTHDVSALKVSYPLYEIEVAARFCESIFKDHWPITYDAFVKNGRFGP